MRKISERAVQIGVSCLLLGVLWRPHETWKWVGSAAYIWAVGRYCGLTYRKERVKGMILKSPYEELNFYNLPRRF